MCNFSFAYQPVLTQYQTLQIVQAFQTFGGIANNTNIQDDIDTCGNGIPMDICLHRSFDRLEWSIEAAGGAYTLRFVHDPTGTGPAIGVASQVVQTGKVLTFGTVGTQPKPELCNLHYAICRFVHMAGMADIFNAVEDDDEEYIDGVLSLEMVDENEVEMELEGEHAVEGDVSEGELDGGMEEEDTSASGRVPFLQEGQFRETVLVN